MKMKFGFPKTDCKMDHTNFRRSSKQQPYETMSSRRRTTSYTTFGKASLMSYTTSLRRRTTSYTTFGSPPECRYDVVRRRDEGKDDVVMMSYDVVTTS